MASKYKIVTLEEYKRLFPDKPVTYTSYGGVKPKEYKLGFVLLENGEFKKYARLKQTLMADFIYHD